MAKTKLVIGQKMKEFHNMQFVFRAIPFGDPKQGAERK